MAWVRGGESPDQIKVSFVVSAKEHPELARFIWSLPYRGTSKILRDILSAAVKTSGAGEVKIEVSGAATGGVSEGETTGGGSPDAESVSAAAASIIGNFDKMFPS